MSKGESPAWISDWDAFVRFVASLADQGKSEAEIVDVVAARRVRWSGVVERLRLGKERYARGVQLRMKPAIAKLRSGMVLKGEFLAPAVPKDLEDRWKGIAEGDEIEFEATVVRQRGPFLGVRIEWDATSGEGLLTVSLDDGCPSRPVPG